MDCQLRKRKQTEQTEQIEKINQKKCARINSDLNEVYVFEYQTPIVDLKTIEERLEIKDFSLYELTRSCINKFKDEMKEMKSMNNNNTFYIDKEKLQ